MCCCAKPNVNGEPGYSWDGKSVSTRSTVMNHQLYAAIPEKYKFALLLHADDLDRAVKESNRA